MTTLRISISAAAFTMIAGAPGLAQHAMPASGKSDDELIRSAMSAAPEAISRDATIIDVGADGKIKQIWPKVKVDGHAKEVLAAVKAG